MVYSIKGCRGKKLFPISSIVCVVVFSLLVFISLFLFHPGKTISSDYHVDTWVDDIPWDLPRDQVILLSEYITGEEFNLDSGKGPLGVKQTDFEAIAPDFFSAPDYESEEQNTKVGYFILRKIYSYYGNWKDTFVHYVYGSYVVKSERPNDVKKRERLLKYLGY